ncbi:hypothetical protein P5V15_006218 [Pogonomyrmex californicus]
MFRFCSHKSILFRYAGMATNHQDNRASISAITPIVALPPFAPHVLAFASLTLLSSRRNVLLCITRVTCSDNEVSWMRSRDLHILTSGDFSFSSDARFGPQHTPGSDAWTLRLDNARKTDSGKYECQVNTEPKIMYAVQLSVRDPDKPEGYDEPHSQQTRISYESTAPVADIMGPREQRVPSGSTITLRCVISSPYQTRPIRGVQWLRDNKLLTFQAARGGINVETEKDAARTVSVLTLAAVTQDDVGNYSCRPTEGRSATVTLGVEEGERTEAMQRDAGYISSGSDVRHWPGLLLPFSWFLILARNSQTFLL